MRAGGNGKRPAVPAERRRMILELLREQGSVSVAAVEEQFRRLADDRAARSGAARRGRLRAPHARRRGAARAGRARGLVPEPARAGRRGQGPPGQGGRRDARGRRDRVRRFLELGLLHGQRDPRHRAAHDAADQLGAGDGLRRKRRCASGRPDRARRQLPQADEVVRRHPDGARDRELLRRPDRVLGQGHRARGLPDRSRPARGRGQARDDRAAPGRWCSSPTRTSSTSAA